jgi:hypothetical protein
MIGISWSSGLGGRVAYRTRGAKKVTLVAEPGTGDTAWLIRHPRRNRPSSI